MVRAGILHVCRQAHVRLHLSPGMDWLSIVASHNNSLLGRELVASVALNIASALRLLIDIGRLDKIQI